MANPFFIQPVSYGGGLAQLGQQIGQLGQQYKQENREEQAMQQQKQAMGKARELLTSGANPSEIAAFSLENPDIGKSLMGAISFKNDATKNNMMESMRAIATGQDPEQVITSRINLINEQGGDPAQSMGELERYKQDPENYIKNMENMYAVLDPKGSESMRKLRPETKAPEPMTDYQSAMITNKKEENRLRAIENDIKRDQVKIKNETDLLKKQQLQDSIDVKKANAEKIKVEAVQQAEDGVQTVQNTVDTVDRLLSHPGLEKATGFQSNFPTISGTDASDFEQTLDTLQSQAFLSAVKQMKGMGALSENEGKKLAGSIGAMSIDMSDVALKKELNRIKETLQIAQIKMRNRMPSKPVSEPQQEVTEQPEQATPNGTVIRNPSTGETMIMQGGQWIPQQAPQQKPSATYRGY